MVQYSYLPSQKLRVSTEAFPELAEATADLRALSSEAAPKNDHVLCLKLPQYERLPSGEPSLYSHPMRPALIFEILQGYCAPFIDMC